MQKARRDDTIRLRIASPFAHSRAEIVATLSRYGYWRFGDRKPPEGTKIMPPEELVAALMYSRDARWKAAIAVVLCRAEIDWPLMVRIAETYRFAGRLHGIVSQVKRRGRHVGDDAALLSEHSPVEINDGLEVLDVYGC